MTATVYLIDSDDYFSSQVMRGCLRMGIKARRIADGNEGVRQALEDQPDAVILGLMDDDGAGYALCSKLRRKARELPVVMVITADEQSSKRLAEHRAMGTAADAYLQRPFSLKLLHETLTSLLPTRLPAPRGALTELVGQNVSSEDALFGGLFEDEDEDDIAAAADEWFASIISDESLAPPDQPPPPPRVHPGASIEMDHSIQMLAVEDLEINLDELVPPEENELLVALQRENANLRDRLANAAAAPPLPPSTDREPSSMGPRSLGPRSRGASSRRELIEARERISERERELLDVRDKLTAAEKDALNLEEALDAVEDKLNAATATAATHASEVTELKTALETAQHNTLTAQALNRALEDEATTRTAALEAANAELESVHQELDGLRGVHADTQAALKAAEEAWENAEAEKDAAAKTAADALKAAIEAAETQGAEAMATARVELAAAEAAAMAELETVKAELKTAQEALAKAKADHTEDMQTLEQMHEEAMSEAVGSRETAHSKATAELLDRAQVAEQALAEKTKALGEYETAMGEADKIAEGLRNEVAAKSADMGIYEASAAEAEEKLAVALKRIEELEPANAALTLDLSSAKSEASTLAETVAQHASNVAEIKAELKALRTEIAAREVAFDKARTALQVAHAFLERASGQEDAAAAEV